MQIASFAPTLSTDAPIVSPISPAWHAFQLILRSQPIKNPVLATKSISISKMDFFAENVEN